jgi:hypothetical protein
MFASNRTTICRALRETRQLLDQHGTTIEPITPSVPLADLLRAATPPSRPEHQKKITSAS